MITQQAQIKINLPLKLKQQIERKANSFDMPLAGYVKHLILSDVKEKKHPEHELSARSEKRAQEALKNIKKAIRVTNVREYFKNL
jgi:hypothetical protein